MTREEAIQEILMSYDISQDVKDAAIEALQERKTGKWISQVGGGYCCSKCGKYALHDVDGKFALLFTKSKYCPNCGARMEVEND